MSNRAHSIRLFSLILSAALLLGMVSLVNAQTTDQPERWIVQQDATPEATPIDYDTPVALEMGKAATTPLGGDVPYRNYTFKGKANQYVEIVTQKVGGNMSLRVRLFDQSDSELATLWGGYMEKVVLTTKLPQDGKYKLVIESGDPGGGDLEAGSVSVMVSETTLQPAPTEAK
jgi:hypothetical protein